MAEFLGCGRRSAKLRVLACAPLAAPLFQFLLTSRVDELIISTFVARQTPWALHEVLLAGWGCPIGELFDLEKLAEHCKQIDRWSFFVTSEVCNVPGGVAR
jgi:hypothetical protein